MSRQTFRPHERLRRRRDFDRVFREGWAVSDQVLVVRGAPNGLSYARLGILVSRKLGKAVQRNRIKRWIREAYRRNKDQLPKGLDFVVIPRRGATLDYHRIERSLLRLARDLDRKKSQKHRRQDRASN